MQFNERNDFHGVNHDRYAKKAINENQNFAHRVGFLTSVLEGNAPPSAAIPMSKRFLIRDTAKTLTGRQKESLAMLSVALEYDALGMLELMGREGVMEVIRRIGN